MKKIILSLFILFSALIYANDIITVEGSLMTNGTNWFLRNDSGIYILNIAPKTWLEEKDIDLQADKSVKVAGKIKENEFDVNVLFYEDKIAVMRDGKGNPLWKPQPKLTYLVNKAKCIGCALCVDACPVDAITMYKGKAVIDIDKCINCDICVKGNKEFPGCPTSAIKQVEIK